MDSKRVGSFIASMRKQKSLTQKELAEKLNVTNKAISKWETGNNNLHNFYALIKYLLIV